MLYPVRKLMDRERNLGRLTRYIATEIGERKIRRRRALYRYHHIRSQWIGKDIPRGANTRISRATEHFPPLSLSESGHVEDKSLAPDRLYTGEMYLH